MPRVLRFLLLSFTTLSLVALCVTVFSFAYISYFNDDKELINTSFNQKILESFPVSVNPATKQIIENPMVNWYVDEYLSLDTFRLKHLSFIDRILSELTQLSLYQQLASPLSRNLVIYAGERKEEVIKHFGDILGWTAEERAEFASFVTSATPAFSEGKFYPGHYVVTKTATPRRVADILISRFAEEILKRYDSDLVKIVPLHDTLVIASLLEREAYSFADMRYISGIIWNRLFIDMPLQIDATLQYIKGNNVNEKKWWSKVKPQDKYINSKFNTYKNIGLPPHPITNPSLEAIIAALNPQKTDCLFYFHDTDSNFYCSVTYEEHVAKLKEIFGQGK